MAHYAVSFRIANKTVNGATYDQRRQSLIDNTWEEGRGYWDETTSFILIESFDDTFAFARSAAAGLSEKEDMLFVFDPSDMSAAYFGKVLEVDVLRSFFPKLKKVP